MSNDTISHCSCFGNYGRSHYGHCHSHKLCTTPALKVTGTDNTALALFCFWKCGEHWDKAKQLLQYYGKKKKRSIRLPYTSFSENRNEVSSSYSTRYDIHTIIPTGVLDRRFLDSLCSFFTTYLGRYVQYRDNILDLLLTIVSVLYHFPFFVTLFLRDSSLLQKKKNVKKRRRVNKQCMHT